MQAENEQQRSVEDPVQGQADAGRVAVFRRHLQGAEVGSLPVIRGQEEAQEPKFAYDASQEQLVQLVRSCHQREERYDVMRNYAGQSRPLPRHDFVRIALAPGRRRAHQAGQRGPEKKARKLFRRAVEVLGASTRQLEPEPEGSIERQLFFAASSTLAEVEAFVRRTFS